jgi:hypothetical protein
MKPLTFLCEVEKLVAINEEHESIIDTFRVVGLGSSIHGSSLGLPSRVILLPRTFHGELLETASNRCETGRCIHRKESEQLDYQKF